jgi:hypothetical protein
LGVNVLIGSRALHHWKPLDFHIKETTDWDVISKDAIPGTEHHPWNFLNNSKMVEFATDDTIEFNGHILNVMSMEGLAIIKRSHLHRNLSFDKHITHYHRHLIPFISDHPTLQERIQLTQEEFKNWHPKLNQSVEKFFDDAVVKIYNHDYLHTLFAYEDEPLYRKMQRDFSLAWCERDMWEKFTHDQKVKCIAEETMVIATERFIVPSNWEYNYLRAFHASLTKVCTTLTSGWFRDYAIDHYPDVLALFDRKKFDEVRLKLKFCDTIEPSKETTS